jgi:acyl-coenzyme A thioesterase PaaI-like protein
MNDAPDHSLPDAIPEGFEAFPQVEGFAVHIGPIYWRRGSEGADIGFRVLPHMCNPAGICHGGMMMTVMDMAIGVAATIAAKTVKFAPSVNLACDFLQPGQLGDWLQSKVDFTFTTRRTGFASGLLIGSNGPVLRANGIVKIPSDGDTRFVFKSGTAPILNDGHA